MGVVLFVMLAVFVKNIDSLQNTEHKRSLQPCSIASVTENEFVKCICNHKSIYRCTLKETSNSTKNYQVYHVPTTYKRSCEPNRAYEYGRMTCICNDNGTWPHNQCDEVLKSLPDFLVAKKKFCMPNTYVTVDCNVCRCNDKGEIDSQRCTNNECEPTDKFDRRNSNTENKIFGDCECGNWYSLAPCQFCFCVNSNKLVCNTGTSYMTNQVFLQLGAYNLNICGKGLGKDLRDLEYNNQDSLRQGLGAETVNPPVPATSSPKPSTSQKPFTQTVVIEPDTVIDENIQSHVSKESSNHDNAAADNASTESDEQEAEDTKQVKNVITPYKQSTKPLIDDEEESEVSNEQAVTAKENNDYQEKNDLKPEDYYEQQQKQAVVPPRVVKRKQQYKKPIALRPFNYQDPEEPKQDSREYKVESDEETAFMPKGLQIPIPHNMKLVDNDDEIQPRQGNPFSNLAFKLKLDLPQMLDKVYQMALRKSMVSIDPTKKCSPGTVDVVKCNTCFCMKNSKLLCTAKKCD